MTNSDVQPVPRATAAQTDAGNVVVLLITEHGMSVLAPDEARRLASELTTAADT